MRIEKDFVEKMFDISGKVAIVTGAAGALGSAVAGGYGFAGCPAQQAFLQYY